MLNNRAFNLCSSFELFHQEILKLKDIFKRNGYPSSFIGNCVKRFLDKVFIEKKTFLTASKKELVCVLPFIGKKSLQLRSRLVKSIQENLQFCSLKVVFQSPCKLRSLFHFKDTLDKKIRSDLVYRLRVVTATLLVMVKLTDISLLEQQNIWESLI